jgi:hypothetical protein
VSLAEGQVLVRAPSEKYLGLSHASSPRSSELGTIVDWMIQPLRFGQTDVFANVSDARISDIRPSNRWQHRN